jgi:hypothetical protein
MIRRVAACAAGIAMATAITTASPVAAAGPVNSITVSASAPMLGAIDYSAAGGIPTLTSGGCFTGTATFNAAIAVDVTVNTTTGSQSEYIGLVDLLGTLNEGGCSTILLETAKVSAMTLTGTTTILGQSLSCGPFTGAFGRQETVVTLTITAPSCNVNGQVTGPVGLLFTGVWAPAANSTLIPGVTAPVMLASVDGAMVLAEVPPLP